MLPYIAEFLGTMILIILGDGVVANVNLNKSGMKGGGTVQSRAHLHGDLRLCCLHLSSEQHRVHFLIRR